MNTSRPGQKLSTEISIVADRIYQSDRQKFARLIVWIKQAQKYHYSDSVIAEALTRFEHHAATTDLWYPYLDKVIDKVEKDRNALQAIADGERYKQELREVIEDAKTKIRSG